MAEEDFVTKMKEFLRKNEFEIIEENKDEIIVRRFFDRVVRGYRVPVSFRITAKELAFLSESDRLKSIFSTISTCSIMSSDVAEFIVAPVGRISKYLIEDTIEAKEYINFGIEKDPIRAIIGKASDNFIGFFRFDKNFINYLVTLRPKGISEILDFSDFFQRPLTIRIQKQPESTTDFSSKFALEIADTCLFHLANISYISLKITNEWDSGGEHFIYSPTGYRFEKELAFPKSKINRELVNYFNRALNGSIPEFQFLGFYHCMEFFFLKISDEQLYQNLRSRIVNPSFNVSDANLDKIVLEVQSHRFEENEVSMLTWVLRRFVNKKDLKEMIDKYEETINIKVYTEKRKICGKEFKIDPLGGSLFDDLSQRIKHIRNEIVHSIDRRGRQKRRWEELEQVVIDELPLMRFLAEQVIVASSEPI